MGSGYLNHWASEVGHVAWKPELVVGVTRTAFDLRR